MVELGVIMTTEETNQQNIDHLLEDTNAVAIQRVNNLQSSIAASLLTGVAAAGLVVGIPFAIDQTIGYSIYENQGLFYANLLAAIAIPTTGMLMYKDKIVSGIMNLFHLKVPEVTKERLEQYEIGKPVLEKVLDEKGYSLEPVKNFLRLPTYKLVQSNSH